MSGFHHIGRRPAIQRDLLAAVILAGGGLLAYANTFLAPFIFDGVALQKQLRNLTWDGQPWLRPPPRTIGYLTFDLQYTLHGDWLPGFHAVNLAIHIAAAWLLYWIVDRTICRSPVAIPLLGKARRLWKKSAAAGCGDWQPRKPSAFSGVAQVEKGHGWLFPRTAWVLALFAALIFELHPLQTQSVTYLYQRFESLMGMLFLASLACFVQVCAATDGRRRAAWSVAAWGCVLLSTATKEVGIVAPLVMLWYDRVFVSDSWKSLRQNRCWFFLPTVFLLCGGGLFLFLHRDHYISGGIFKTESVGAIAYARTQPAVILHYVRLFFWPRGQCLDLVWSPADEWHEIWPPFAGLAGLCCLTGWAILKRPWLGFLLGTFFLILAPTSSFLPIVDLAFEHRMYLPVAALSVAIVVLGSVMLSAVCRAADCRPAGVFVGSSLAVAIVLMLGVTTYQRNESYRTGAAVWADVLKTRPNNPRALSNLAWNLEVDPTKTEMAIQLHRRALAIRPDLAVSHRGLATLLGPRSPGQALHHAREAMRLEPRDAVNLNNLAILLAEDQPKESERLFRASLELDPHKESVVLNLARLLIRQNRLDAAIDVLQAALDLHPDWSTTKRIKERFQQPRGKTSLRPAAETAAPPPPAAR